MNVLILDLDGTVISLTGYGILNDSPFIELNNVLLNWKEKGGVVSVLTNRSGAEMQPIAYFLKEEDGFWITESCASVFDVNRSTARCLPKWRIYAVEHVPQLREFLRKKIPNFENSPDESSFYSGLGFVRTVIVPPKKVSSVDFYSQIINPLISETKFSELFEVKVSKLIDIVPKGISKKEGLKNLILQNGWSKQDKLFFVADHTRDIEAAEEIIANGGVVSAVGNADEIYKRFIKQKKGIQAPDSTSYHSSVSYILKEFLK